MPLELPSMSWSDVLQSLDAIIAGIAPDPSWEAAQRLSRRRTEVMVAFDKDMEELAQGADFIFSADLDPALYTRAVSDLFRRWHRSEQPPTLCAISAFAMHNFGMNEDDPLARAVMMAGVLGGVENTLAYHSNMHFKKVLVQAVSLMSMHNALFENQPRELQRDQIALMMIAACIHDLGHDGQSNIVDGTYIPSRAEKRSFGLAKPYLVAAGLEESELDDILVMLLATDISSFPDRASPSGQIKQAYRQHFFGGDKVAPDSGLEIVQKRADLTATCLLLHEADVSTSAGLDYDVTTFETALHRSEFANDRARPSHVVSFIEKICGGTMLSEAAQRLYNTNMAEILRRAKEDVSLGDNPYPPAEDSDFLLGLSSFGARRGETLN